MSLVSLPKVTFNAGKLRKPWPLVCRFLALALLPLFTTGMVTFRPGIESPPRQILPLTNEVEALPTESLVDLRSGMFFRRPLPDGREIQLVNEGRTLRVGRRGHFSDFSLPVKATYLFMTTNEVAILYAEINQGHFFIGVGLSSGKTLMLPVGSSNYMRELGQTTIFVTNYGFYVYDADHDAWLSHQRSEPATSDLIGNFGPEPVLLAKSQHLLLSYTEKRGYEEIAVPTDIAWDYCARGSGFIKCTDAGSTKQVYFINDHRVVRADNESWLDYDPDQQRVLFTDPATGHMFVRARDNSIKPIFFNSSRATDRITYINYFNSHIVGYTTRAQILEINRHDLWRAIDLDSSDALIKLHRVGNFVAGQDIGEVINNYYGAEYQSGDWAYRQIEDAILFWRLSNPALRYRLPVPPGTGVKLNQAGGFAQIKRVAGSNEANELVDLQTGRRFDLGFGEVLFAPDGLGLTVANAGRTYRYNLRALREPPVRAPGLLENSTREPLPKSLLAQCEASVDERAQPLAARLLQMRNGRVPFYESDLRDLLGYRLNSSELILLAHVLQKFSLDSGDAAELAFNRLKIYARFENITESLTTNPCLTEFELSTLQKGLYAVLGDQLGGSRAFPTVQRMIVLAPIVRSSLLFGDDRISNLADHMAEGAALTPLLHGVYFSKLHYFASAVIAPIFGQPRVFKTDLTVTSEGNDAQIILLSTHPTTGYRAHLNSAGFYEALVERIPMSATPGSSAQRDVEWRSHGMQFNAHLNITTHGDLRTMAPTTAALDHVALRKDGHLTGLMVIGTNLSADDAAATLRNYKSFYSDYTFSEPRTIDSFNVWFADHIRSGEVDYLIKEAHADGDEKNFFRVAVNADLFTGQKRAADGTIEVIYLAVPHYAGQFREGDELLANEKFGDWVRERERAGQGPLIYLNTSCNSFVKVLAEIAATRSHNFIPIPSITGVTEFRAAGNNVTAMFIRGLQTRQTWAQMRALMEKNPDVKSETVDTFLFPDDPRYETRIRAHLGLAFTADVQVHDAKTGARIDFDRFNH